MERAYKFLKQTLKELETIEKNKNAILPSSERKLRQRRKNKLQKNFFEGLATVFFYFFVKETVRQRRMKKMQSIFF